MLHTPEEIKSKFLLKKEITYLNFGAYGACPQPIFDTYQHFQRELEAEPTLFINELGPQYIKDSRIALGKYLNCSADDVVYVTSPSYAVNIIAKSIQIKAGDEVLTTNLEYGPCDKTWKYYLLPFDSTAENLCKYFANLIITENEAFLLSNKIEWVGVKIYETETAYAYTKIVLGEI